MSEILSHRWRKSTAGVWMDRELRSVLLLPEPGVVVEVVEAAVASRHAVMEETVVS